MSFENKIVGVKKGLSKGEKGMRVRGVGWGGWLSFKLK